MMFFAPKTRVFLAPGTTDMRKAINGLSLMVETLLEQDPLSGHLFVFCNRSCTQIKILYWDRNGFCLWQKRLEKHRFPWPQNLREAQEIGPQELAFLLEGVDIRKVRTYPSLHYARIN